MCIRDSRRIEAPLLARVVAKELFVQLATDLADDNVFRRPHSFNRFSNLLEKLFDFKRSQAQTVESVDRVEIDRNGNDLPVDTRAHAMLIRTPLGKPREILKHLARVRVKYMRAVLCLLYTSD